MQTIKLMPCLDIKDGRVVKGVHFTGLKLAGDPVENAVFYQREGADELAMLDIGATVEQRGIRLDWVRQVSSAIEIPLTAGGGIASLSDIEKTLSAGAARISINTCAVKNPSLVERAAEMFGSATVTVAMDARRNPETQSGFELVVSGGTRPTGKDLVEWAKQCEQLGAGVLLPTSIDSDGVQQGYDIELIKAVSGTVGIPVVASGGAGTLEDFYEAVVRGGAGILLAASVFHFRKFSIMQVKEYLRDKGLSVTAR